VYQFRHGKNLVMETWKLEIIIPSGVKQRRCHVLHLAYAETMLPKHQKDVLLMSLGLMKVSFIATA